MDSGRYYASPTIPNNKTPPIGIRAWVAGGCQRNLLATAFLSTLLCKTKSKLSRGAPLYSDSLVIVIAMLIRDLTVDLEQNKSIVRHQIGSG